MPDPANKKVSYMPNERGLHVGTAERGDDRPTGCIYEWLACTVTNNRKSTKS
jgi:hypothetical protein